MPKVEFNFAEYLGQETLWMLFTF